MSKATVYSTAQYGTADDSSATGLFVGTVSYNGTADVAESPNHIGCVVGISVYNERKDISVEGIVAVKGSGLAADMGGTLTLANTTANSRTRLGEAMSATATSTVIIVTGADLTSSATGFETGSISGVYYPSLSATTTTLT